MGSAWGNKATAPTLPELSDTARFFADEAVRHARLARRWAWASMVFALAAIALAILVLVSVL